MGNAYRTNKRLCSRPPRFREPLCQTSKRNLSQRPNKRKLIQALKWRPTKRRNSSKTRFGTWSRVNGFRSNHLPWVRMVCAVEARVQQSCLHIQHLRVIYSLLNPKLASLLQDEAESCVRPLTETSIQNPVYLTNCIRPNGFQERLHTIFPLTQVLTTYPSSSSTVKSASAPGLSVPFRFSIPKQLCNSFSTNPTGNGRKEVTLQG